MLVLTRKVGEKIVISDDICVTVVEVSGDRVRIGVEAPKSVRVDRHEVHVRRQLDPVPRRQLQLAEAF
jgi:carbon storage regulator